MEHDKYLGMRNNLSILYKSWLLKKIIYICAEFTQWRIYWEGECPGG